VSDDKRVTDGPYGPEWTHEHTDGSRHTHPSGVVCHFGKPTSGTQMLVEAARGKGADTVDHPAHYLAHPSGVECITITEHMGFNLGNVVKYVWRADLKGDAIEDLKKARWYLTREIERLETKP